MLPNIHTSLCEVNFLKLILSGAIHLIGILVFEAFIKIKFCTQTISNKIAYKRSLPRYTFSSISLDKPKSASFMHS